MRGWTQAETAGNLEPYLGVKWSKASLSNAERSIDGGRIKVFGADEILAFARLFKVPVSTFFTLPTSFVRGKDPHVNPPHASAKPLTRIELSQVAEFPMPPEPKTPEEYERQTQFAQAMIQLAVKELVKVRPGWVRQEIEAYASGKPEPTMKPLTPAEEYRGAQEIVNEARKFMDQPLTDQKSSNNRLARGKQRAK